MSGSAFRARLARTAPAFLILMPIVVAAVFTGCQPKTTIKKALSVDARSAGLDKVVLHYTRSYRVMGRLWYQIGSVHAGSMPVTSCAEQGVPEAGPSNAALTIRDCRAKGSVTSAELSQLRDAIGKATAALENYFEGVAISEVELTLVPGQARYVGGGRWYWRRADDLAVQLAISFGEDSDSYLRAAVRSYAHEVAHLAAKALGSGVSPQNGEALASLTEICVEGAVFGDAHLEAAHETPLPEEMARAVGSHMAVSATQSAATRESIASAHASGNFSLREYCRERLSIGEKPRRKY